jgi:hypothetical protein
LSELALQVTEYMKKDKALEELISRVHRLPKAELMNKKMVQEHIY